MLTLKTETPPVTKLAFPWKKEFLLQMLGVKQGNVIGFFVGEMGVFRHGYLQGIQREDGSGNCFIVTLLDTGNGKRYDIFHRCES